MSANKRRANKHRQETRQTCWERGQQRKAQRRDAQAAAEQANRTAGTTPWQQAKQTRAAARAGKTFAGKAS